ncbi:MULTISPECIES: inorganic phosphate transporter [Bacteroidota]|jgi:PiT family inorganic phosphate transporter|uniref:Phosphate transporter n=2 Tax=Flectobacillus TaxID=101 RepID=A0ABT6Z3Q8_9BACT|nr:MULTISPECIES: inorganic phosphate transporter [Bacteroidota]MDI9864648.1 inorganic phosphate transporter [Flectobacillus longus]MDI9875758.1 inorganic phosphate transporter [Flectobacillus rivi]NBB27576.1 inorganic phosphate transporter [Cellulophaga sp. BC115SP]
MFGLDTSLFILLFLCLFLACAFEFVNGFHDTANAVATVIYTNSLKPTQAVVWSGFMNFIGLLTGGVGVTMSIIGLLPTELLIDPNVYHSMATALAMLGAAIIWNLGTWYFGIPASSSHTLIGSIIGIGVGYALLPENKAGLSTVNWDKATEIGQALLLSPLFGFAVAIVFMYILKKSVANKEIFKEPKKDTPPPMWIRGILFLTCTLVSFFHGRNDGQKGIGLVMMILIAFLPSYFAINTDVDPFKLQGAVVKVQTIIAKIDTNKLSSTEKESYTKVMKATAALNTILTDKSLINHLSTEKKLEIRKDVLAINKHTKKLSESDAVSLSADDKKELKKATAGDKAPFFSFGNSNKGLSSLTDFAPAWVMWMIALSLGLGTMIGWKRIVVTIGEKIGKQHLSYAQGASAELVASITIGLATAYKWPVSTTHVLSSGIAGSMVASKGIKNLQGGTVKNIVMAWVLTLPVTILLSATLFVFFRWIIG